MFYLVLVNGLIDSFNPCAIGVLIFYISLILSLKLQRKTFIRFGLFYIFATYATYFLIGLGLLQVMHLFGIHNFFGWLAAVLVIIVGLHSLKDFIWPGFKIPYLSPFLSRFLNRCRIPKWEPRVTVISAITLGVLIGLCEFPCSGGVYLATVSLLSAKNTFWQGVGYLLVYNSMFILPLVALFVSVGNKPVFDYLQKLHTKTVSATRLIMGISMVFSGILLIIWLLQEI